VQYSWNDTDGGKSKTLGGRTCTNSLEANSGERFFTPHLFPLITCITYPTILSYIVACFLQRNSPARVSNVSLLRFLDPTPGKTDQPVAKATTYTIHNEHSTRTSMPSAEFEPATPAINIRKHTS
jgi:hypothetical protein